MIFIVYRHYLENIWFHGIVQVGELYLSEGLQEQHITQVQG